MSVVVVFVSAAGEETGSTGKYETTTREEKKPTMSKMGILKYHMFSPETVEKGLSAVHHRYHSGGGEFVPVGRNFPMRILPKSLKSDPRAHALLLPAVSSSFVKPKHRGVNRESVVYSGTDQEPEDEEVLSPAEREEAEAILYQQ